MRCITCLEYCDEQTGNVFSCKEECLIITKIKNVIVEYDALFKYKDNIYRLYSRDNPDHHTILYKKIICLESDVVSNYDYNEYVEYCQINHFYESDIFDENFLFNLTEKLILLKTFS